MRWVSTVTFPPNFAPETTTVPVGARAASDKDQRLVAEVVDDDVHAVTVGEVGEGVFGPGCAGVDDGVEDAQRHERLELGRRARGAVHRQSSALATLAAMIPEPEAPACEHRLPRFGPGLEELLHGQRPEHVHPRGLQHRDVLGDGAEVGDGTTVYCA
jgi:hypothetical protein